MEFEEIRLIISKAIEQTKNHQIDLLMRWLDGILLKYRESTLCKFKICFSKRKKQLIKMWVKYPKLETDFIDNKNMIDLVFRRNKFYF